MDLLFVSCPHPFEPVLQKELSALGIKDTRPGFCGVYVPKTMDAVYKINYGSRIAMRVLWPLVHFACPDKEALYKAASSICWNEYLQNEQTFAIDANVDHPLINNSHFAALVVKDAICDFFREKEGSRPSVDIKSPDVQLNLFIQKERATLYLDTSLIPLYKRGWRQKNTEATLHETLAAGLLSLSRYNPERVVLCDPFCGSGTFLIEAAMMATKTPAGYFRKKWGFSSMPLFKQEDWDRCKEESNRLITPLAKGRIFGADKDPQAIALCKEYLQSTGFASCVEVSCSDVSDLYPKIPPSFIIANLPYGKRLRIPMDMYESLASFLKNRCTPTAEAHILCADVRPLQALPKDVRRSFSFKNGGLPVTFASLH